MAERLTDSDRRNQITPDELVEGVRVANKLKRELDEVNGKYRAHLKGLEKKGADLKAVAMMRKWMQEDDDESAIRLKTALKYAAWMELPIGTQPGLFPEEAVSPEAVSAEIKAAKSRDDAYYQGWDAHRKHGASRSDNPNQAGTELYVSWDEGYLASEAKAGGEMDPSANKRAQAKAAKPNPGRRGGAQQAEAAPVGPVDLSTRRRKKSPPSDIPTVVADEGEATETGPLH
jgi:hypothetical protein